MRSRPFLTRLLLTGLGMLFLGVTGYAGLGWAVQAHWRVCERVLGRDRWVRLHAAYVRALGIWLPADSDGDGFADSVERYLRTDTHNPADQPDAGFIDDDLRFKALDGENHRFLPICRFKPGEHRRMHRWLGGITGQRMVFARGMKLLLEVSPPCQLSLPGGTLVNGSLLVPVAADGAVEFDIAVPDAAPTDVFRNPVLSYGMLGSNFTRNGFMICIASPLPPLPCTVEEVPLAELAQIQPDGQFEPGTHALRLTWRPAGLSGPYYIEATRDGSEQEWFPFAVCDADRDHCLVAYTRQDSTPGPRGPIRFRVIPTKPVPAKE